MILLTVPRQCFFSGPFLLAMFHICLCYTVLSVLCSLVVTFWKRAYLLALLCIVFCHYPIPYVAWSISELRVSLVPLDTFKPSSILLTVLRRCILLWILFVIYLSCLSLFCSCLFLAALWSHAGKRVISWFSCVLCFLVLCHIPVLCPGSGVVLHWVNSWSLSPSNFYNLIHST